MYATKLSSGKFLVTQISWGHKTTYQVNAADGFSAIIKVLELQARQNLP
jgi:hypothetical protein